MVDILVVGNGPAAHRFVTQLRKYGNEDSVVILGAEDTWAYHRSLLTSIMDGTLPSAALALPPLDGDTQVVTGIRASHIDRWNRVVLTDGGSVFGYDRLVLATGSTPRIPDIDGLFEQGELANGITTLRTLGDYEQITTDHVTILGAGVLGVEVAFALRSAGKDVTLVHPHCHPMERNLDDMAGRLLTEMLIKHDIEVYFGQKAVEYTQGRLILADATSLKTGTLVLSTGTRPEVGLARTAGLRVGTGVVVDEELRTNDPNIYAIGDCAEHARDHPGSLTTAWAQAETLASLITTGSASHRLAEHVVRPRIPGFDVVALGQVDSPDSLCAADETITLSDAAHGRYARLELSKQRIVSAVLVGWERAIATVTQLYESNRQVPSDRLALLLGTTPTHGPESGVLPDHAVVCVCSNVTKKALKDVWREGANEFDDLVRATRATTGCGGCVDEVRAVCRALGTPEQIRSGAEVSSVMRTNSE